MTTELQEALIDDLQAMAEAMADGDLLFPPSSHYGLYFAAAKRWSAVQEAITNEGPQPRLHRQIMKRHRKEWPTLWAALTVREDGNAPTT